MILLFSRAREIQLSSTINSPILRFWSTLRNVKRIYSISCPTLQKKFFGPGWAWDDYNWYYSVERGDFPIYGNVAKFTFKPGIMIPEVEPFYFANLVGPDSTYTGKSSLTTRDFYGNKFIFQHSKESKRASSGSSV